MPHGFVAGAERAELTAEFSVENNREAREWLEESDLSSDSADGICLLRRTISNNGRSRAYINGSPVTVAQIQSLGHRLVEIHGQNEHLRLTRTAEQFKLLDGSGDYRTEMATLESAFADWQTLSRELNALEQDVAIPAGELEFLNHQLTELQQYDLSADALDDLQTEHDRLAAGESLLDVLSIGIELLDPESSDDQAGINSDLHTTIGQLQKFSALDTDINDACNMLREAAVNCAEATRSLHAARDRVDLNPERFEKVSRTLARLHDLARKHHVRMEGLAEVMHTLASRIERAGQLGTTPQRATHSIAEAARCLPCGGQEPA